MSLNHKILKNIKPMNVRHVDDLLFEFGCKLPKHFIQPPTYSVYFKVKPFQSVRDNIKFKLFEYEFTPI